MMAKELFRGILRNTIARVRSKRRIVGVALKTTYPPKPTYPTLSNTVFVTILQQEQSLEKTHARLKELSTTQLVSPTPVLPVLKDTDLLKPAQISRV